LPKLKFGLSKLENMALQNAHIFASTNYKSMKKIIIIISLFSALWSHAQMPKLAVVSFQSQEVGFKNAAICELIRMEISKTEKYEIIDRFETSDVLNQNNTNIESCLSKSCLIKAGNWLNADYVLSGSADLIGNTLYMKLRLYNVKNEFLVKEVIRNFQNIPEQMAIKLTICVNELLGKENDQSIVNSLTKSSSFDNALNNPEIDQLNLAGPRMGYTFLFGNNASYIRLPKDQGGYDAFPAFFQMGYQFEKQYLNEGKFQALFEFIPMVTGIDQGLFIPSFTIMNGLRNNIKGWEIGVGPSVSFSKMSDMYFDNGIWYQARSNLNENNKEVVRRLDSKGSVALVTSVVIAAGATIRSGKLNLPINIFAVPSRDNFRLGVSFGFNSRTTTNN